METIDNLYLNDLVQKQLHYAMEHVSKEAAHNLDAFVQGAFDPRVPWGGRLKCVSPIESVFYTWWQVVEMVRRIQDRSMYCPLELHEEYEIQVNGAAYRVDFMIQERFDGRPNTTRQALAIRMEVPLIAVELDGHDFHEKTKEQATYRNQRDRDLQRAGWKVFHFSGSELVKRGVGCAEEVYDYAEDRFMELGQAYSDRVHPPKPMDFSFLNKPPDAS